MTRPPALRARVYRYLWPALALAACQQDRPAPTSAPGGPGAATASVTAGAPLTCDVRDARALARGYFDPPERRRVAELLRALDDAYDAGDAVTARELGFDVLAVAEEVADAGAAAGTPGEGSDLANAVLACMDVGHGTAVDFSGALALFGAFGVRGGPADPATAPVLARGSAPLWGAEPAGGAAWTEVLDPEPGVGSSPGERRLLHATPLASTGFTDEVPASSAYEWGTVPTAGFAPLSGELAVGACLDEPDPRLRVQRSSTVLPLAGLTFCDGGGSGLLATGRGEGGRHGDPGVLTRLAGAMAALLAPSPLRASAALFGGVGGRLSSFSPIVVVDAGAVNLAFTLQPADAPVGGPIPVEVTARGDGGTPLQDVTVALEIEENNASFGELSGTTTARTGPDGVASFLVSLNKPGGFRLTAAGDLSGFAASTAVSELFHLTW